MSRFGGYVYAPCFLVQGRAIHIDLNLALVCDLFEVCPSEELHYLSLDLLIV